MGKVCKCESISNTHEALNSLNYCYSVITLNGSFLQWKNFKGSPSEVQDTPNILYLTEYIDLWTVCT